MFRGMYLTNIKVSSPWMLPSTGAVTRVVFKDTARTYHHFLLPTSSVPPTITDPDKNGVLRISGTEVPKWRHFLALDPKWQCDEDSAWGRTENVIHVSA
jgi:hypothetical protein